MATVEEPACMITVSVLRDGIMTATYWVMQGDDADRIIEDFTHRIGVPHHEQMWKMEGMEEAAEGIFARGVGQGLLSADS